MSRSLATLLLLSASGLGAQTVRSLSRLKDRARPLLIFAATADDPQVQTQLRYLQADAKAVAEREIVAVGVPGTGLNAGLGRLGESEADAARRRFRVAAGEFVVILIGKDGGEKLRSKVPLTVEKLVETVDAMPMRQDEMKTRKP